VPGVLCRFRSLADKGPEHWLGLGRSLAAVWRQRLAREWSPEAVDEGAFLKQLQLKDVTPAAVGRHFRDRSQPRLGAAAADVISSVTAEARALTLTAADTVCRGEFQFRGQPWVTFDDMVDWFHQPANNVDWRWELNRHGYFVTLGRAFAHTGDARYLTTFRRLLLDWLQKNPPDVDASNWVSVLEVAYRANVWAWAFTHFRARLDDDALVACLRGLWLHGRFLAANLEYASANNHLWLESKALLMLGLLFPEFRAAKAWTATGQRVLCREVARQVSPDGVHWEQATLYHRILASELVELLTVMEDNAHAIPHILRRVLAHMLTFESVLLKPDGEPPLIGDSTAGDSYLRFNSRLAGAALGKQPNLISGDLDEGTLWLIGSKRAEWLRQNAGAGETPESRAFAQGGYCVMRADERYLIFDCGPFGYPLAPGHGHADALSFEWFANGHTWLVDPGVFSYHLGADWRHFFRSTAAHNTVVVDGHDQSQLLDAWRVLNPARTRLREWISNAEYDFADAEHDGYTRLAEPVVHRRQILFVKPDYVIVFDQLIGAGRHHIAAHFHFAPEIKVDLQATTGLARLTHVDGSAALLAYSGPTNTRADVIRGSTTPIQGWVSRHSGEKQPAAVLRLSITDILPVQMVTVLMPTHIHGLTLTRLPVRDEAHVQLSDSQGIAVGIVTEGWVDEIALDRRDPPAGKLVGAWSSVERVSRLRLGGGPGQRNMGTRPEVVAHG